MFTKVPYELLARAMQYGTATPESSNVLPSSHPDIDNYAGMGVHNDNDSEDPLTDPEEDTEDAPMAASAEDTVPGEEVICISDDEAADDALS